MKLNRSFLSRNNWAFILIFLFVGVVSYIPYKYAQEKTIVRNDKYLELQALTELKSKQVRQWQKERGSEVKFFSESQPFIQYAQEIAKGLKQNEDLLRNSLVKIMSDNRYENIFILNETGDILFSVLPGKSSIDSLTRIHAMEAFRSGKITVPELYYSKFQKKIQWEVFAPINENNKIIATVLFLIDPSDFFFPMIRDWPASTKTEEALLVRRDGQQFICITPLKKADNSKLQLSFPLDQKENILGSELYEGPDYSGDMVVANISKIPRSSWFLIVKEDSSEVYADFHKLFTLIVILIILFILFAIVLVSMVYHRKQKNLYKKLLHQSNTLHHTQEELGATLYSIGDGVITTNAEGYINHMNPAAESLTGWSELEAKGKWIGEIFQIVDENTGKKIENPLFHLLNEREKNPAVVYLTLLSRGKKEIYIRNSGALIKDKQGERLGTILFFSDQSESKLRQKLIELRLNFFEFSVRHTLQETLTYILDEIGKFTHSPLGFIHFVMDDQQTIESRAWSTQTQQEFCKIEKSGCHCDVRQAGIWADCIKTKKILVHNNYADVVNKKEYPQGHPFLTRELVVPVFRDQKIKALLGIGNKPTDYTDLDVEIVSFLADVSWELAEYKKRGELLQQSEERFERLFERAPLGYQSLDENGNIIEINEAWTETLGYNREEVIGKWFDNFLAPHEAEKFRRELPSFKQKDNVHIVFEMIKKDGQHRFLSIEARAGYKNDGSFEKTHCIMKDITEQKIIEERLRESEEKMGSIFQVAPTGIGVVKDRIILEVNPRFCEMTGYLKEELIGQNTRMLYQTEEEFERIRKEISDQLTLEGNGTMETTHKRKDGTPISVILSHTLLDSTDPSKGFTFNVLDITERKSAEIAIKEHERQLTSMVGNLPGFIYRCKNDESWTMLFISQMCFNITGYRPEELISNKRITFNDIIVKEYRSIVRDKWEAVISNNSFFELEYKIVRADNRIIWVLERGVGIYDDKGEILFLEGYIEDISQRKEAEETIRLLFDSTAEGIFGIDTKGNCTFCNNAALKMLGYSEEMEMVGQNVHELIHHHQQSGSGLSKEDCSIYKVFREGTMSHSDNEVFWKKNETHFPIEYWAYPMMRNDLLTGAVVTFMDITQRKRDEVTQQILFKIARTSMTTKALEDILLFIRQELSRVFDTSSFYVARYKSASRTFERIDFINKKFDFHELDTRNSLSEYVVNTGKSLLLQKQMKMDFYSKTGIDPFETSAECWLGVPLMDEKESIGIIVVQNFEDPLAFDASTVHLLEMIAHELTVVIQKTMMVEDLINAKEKAEESDRLKSAFLANMSHEIRTPMNGILGFLSLINEPDLEEENRKEYIDIVNKSGQRLLETINDIIEISKIEAGIIEINNKPVDVAEKMNFFLQFFKPQANQKGLEFIISEQINGPSAVIEADASKIGGILTNLIKNAIKFTDKGSIKLGNYIANHSLVFYVSDSGPGIPGDRKDAIFERFVQGDLNLTRAHEGSGLGLAISKAYINAMNGKIWLTSEVGVGSTFFFSIPYNPVIEKINGMKKVESNILSMKQLTILIAEDDTISYKFLERVLMRENIRLLHSKDGYSTVKTFKENPDIDLILMDIKMPGMDGLEATREIRKFNELIPIIAQTANALSQDDMIAIEAGCNDYLAKPINQRTLIGMINKYTKKEPKTIETIKR